MLISRGSPGTRVIFWSLNWGFRPLFAMINLIVYVELGNAMLVFNVIIFVSLKSVSWPGAYPRISETASIAQGIFCLNRGYIFRQLGTIKATEPSKLEIASWFIWVHWLSSINLHYNVIAYSPLRAAQNTCHERSWNNFNRKFLLTAAKSLCSSHVDRKPKFDLFANIEMPRGIVQISWFWDEFLWHWIFFINGASLCNFPPEFGSTIEAVNRVHRFDSNLLWSFELLFMGFKSRNANFGYFTWSSSL